jgi:hypothetical protein
VRRQRVGSDHGARLAGELGEPVVVRAVVDDQQRHRSDESSGLQMRTCTRAPRPPAADREALGSALDRRNVEPAGGSYSGVTGPTSRHNATLTGDMAAGRQLLRGLWGKSSTSSANRISSSSMACFSSGVSHTGQTISTSSSTSQ